jgi:hypothetical protein
MKSELIVHENDDFPSSFYDEPNDYNLSWFRMLGA